MRPYMMWMLVALITGWDAGQHPSGWWLLALATCVVVPLFHDAKALLKP